MSDTRGRSQKHVLMLRHVLLSRTCLDGPSELLAWQQLPSSLLCLLNHQSFCIWASNNGAAWQLHSASGSDSTSSQLETGHSPNTHQQAASTAAQDAAAESGLQQHGLGKGQHAPAKIDFKRTAGQFTSAAAAALQESPAGNSAVENSPAKGPAVDLAEAAEAAAAVTYTELAASVYKATEEVVGPVSIGDLLFGLQAVAKQHREKGLAYDIHGTPVWDRTLCASLLDAADLAYAAYKINPQSACAVSHLRLHNIRKFVPHNSHLRPAYFLAVDHAQELIIWAIRGTKNVSDVITDISGSSTPLDGGRVHWGMLHASQALLKEELPHLGHLSSTYPGYKIMVVGHSLGAGVAALVAYLINTRPSLRRQVCYSPSVYAVAIAPPPVMSESLAAASEPYVTSVINSHDPVPRLTPAAVQRLRKELLGVNWAAQLRATLLEAEYTQAVTRAISSTGSNTAQTAAQLQKLAGELLQSRHLSNLTAALNMVVYGRKGVGSAVAASHAVAAPALAATGNAADEGKDTSDTAVSTASQAATANNAAAAAAAVTASSSSAESSSGNSGATAALQVVQHGPFSSLQTVAAPAGDNQEQQLKAWKQQQQIDIIRRWVDDVSSKLLPFVMGAQLPDSDIKRVADAAVQSLTSSLSAVSNTIGSTISSGWKAAPWSTTAASSRSDSANTNDNTAAAGKGVTDNAVPTDTGTVDPINSAAAGGDNAGSATWGAAADFAADSFSEGVQRLKDMLPGPAGDSSSNSSRHQSDSALETKQYAAQQQQQPSNAWFNLPAAAGPLLTVFSNAHQIFIGRMPVGNCSNSSSSAAVGSPSSSDTSGSLGPASTCGNYSAESMLQYWWTRGTQDQQHRQKQQQQQLVPSSRSCSGSGSSGGRGSNYPYLPSPGDALLGKAAAGHEHSLADQAEAAVASTVAAAAEAAAAVPAAAAAAAAAVKNAAGFVSTAAEGSERAGKLVAAAAAAASSDTGAGPLKDHAAAAATAAATAASSAAAVTPMYPPGKLLFLVRQGLMRPAHGGSKAPEAGRVAYADTSRTGQGVQPYEATQASNEGAAAAGIGGENASGTGHGDAGQGAGSSSPSSSSSKQGRLKQASAAAAAAIAKYRPQRARGHLLVDPSLLPGMSQHVLLEAARDKHFDSLILHPDIFSDHRTRSYRAALLDLLKSTAGHHSINSTQQQ